MCEGVVCEKHISQYTKCAANHCCFLKTGTRAAFDFKLYLAVTTVSCMTFETATGQYWIGSLDRAETERA